MSAEWFADSWISLVYQTQRYRMADDVQIEHLMTQTTRYKEPSASQMKEHFFEVWKSKATLDKLVP